MAILKLKLPADYNPSAPTQAPDPGLYNADIVKAEESNGRNGGYYFEFKCFEQKGGAEAGTLRVTLTKMLTNRDGSPDLEDAKSRRDWDTLIRIIKAVDPKLLEQEELDLEMLVGVGVQLGVSEVERKDARNNPTGETFVVLESGAVWGANEQNVRFEPRRVERH